MGGQRAVTYKNKLGWPEPRVPSAPLAPVCPRGGPIPWGSALDPGATVSRWDPVTKGDTGPSEHLPPGKKLWCKRTLRPV